MGSWLSGNRRRSRVCTDSVPWVDVRVLHRAGALHAGTIFEVNFKYAGSTTWICVVDELLSCVNVVCQGSLHSILLDWTGCHFGGRRAWFICPACSKRVALLSLSERPVCRRCLGMIYRSQCESSLDRAIRRLGRGRTILGWTQGIANENGGKPKGMHWKTYAKTKERYLVEERRVLGLLFLKMRPGNQSTGVPRHGGGAV